VAALGCDAVAYSSATHYLYEARCLHSDEEPLSVEISMVIDDADQAILFALGQNPFALVQQLSRLTDLSSTTIYPRFTQSLGCTARHLQCVPHALSDGESADQTNLSLQLFATLDVARDRAWHDIVTLDESWFYLSTDHAFIWLARDDTLPERRRYMVQSNKFMLAIAWNPRVFHFINVLQKGRGERKLII
jgi:hypothetical protein